MKKYFVETNGYNMVILADGSGRGLIINDTAFDTDLTLAAAQAADYSGLDGFDTIDECNANYGNGDNIIDFDPDNANWTNCIITEF